MRIPRRACAAVVLFVTAAATGFDQPAHASKARPISIVSIGANLTTGNASSGGAFDAIYPPSVSADDHYAAFTSAASNFAQQDTNEATDIFLKDLLNPNAPPIPISVSACGVSCPTANGRSSQSSVSSNGRYVAFDSEATDLTAEPDTNGYTDVFRRDVVTSTTELVSLTNEGFPLTESSFGPSMTADGNRIAFTSLASGVGAESGKAQVVVRDLTTSQTITASVGASGIPGDAPSGHPTITPDGTKVVFHSLASNLVEPADDDGHADVYMRDLVANTTTRITEGLNADALNPVVSADGNVVAFQSGATNIDGDTAGVVAVYTADLAAGITELVSKGPGGEIPDDDSELPSISADGEVVAFHSLASNLVPGDDNADADVFVKAGAAAATIASLSDTGEQETAKSFGGVLSPSGGIVAFVSGGKLQPSIDTNDFTDVYAVGVGRACPGSMEAPDGPLSGPLDATVKPFLGPAGPAAGFVACDVLVPAGL